MTTKKTPTPTYGRCRIPGASPATLQVTAWHSFTGRDREIVDAMGGEPFARVQLRHDCGLRVSMPTTSSWAWVQQQVAQHFGPIMRPEDEEHLRRELATALAAATPTISALVPIEVRQQLVDQLTPMLRRREADAAAAGLDAVRLQLAHHATAADDPCEDRGAYWPCDVALALWPDLAAVPQLASRTPGHDPDDPLNGWEPCGVTGCPLSDPEAAEPDDIDDMRDSGMAHGVQHVDIGDQWWIRTEGTDRA
ncbi:hypothetical protein AB0F93_03645 [Micromonospora tulbaghiae]|uniref:hypothetical protein n=1 Tax=Micromonospora tulbaghiae TaxID=479978 RepID=UPI00331CF816